MSLLKKTELFSKLISKAQAMSDIQNMNVSPSVQDKNPAFYLNQLQSAISYFQSNSGHTFDATTKNYLTNLNSKVISPLKLMNLDQNNLMTFNSAMKNLSTLLSKEEQLYLNSLNNSNISTTMSSSPSADGVMNMPADEIRGKVPSVKTKPQINIKQVEDDIALAKSVVQQVSMEVAKPSTNPERKGSLLGKLYVYRVSPLLNVYNKLMAMKTPENPVLNSSYENLLKQLESFINSTKQVLGMDNFQFLAQVDRNTLPKFAQVSNNLNTIKQKCFNISNSLYSLIGLNDKNKKNENLKEVARTMAQVQDLFNANNDSLKDNCARAIPMLKTLNFFLNKANSGTGYEPQLDVKLANGKSISMMIADLYNVCLKAQA